MQDPIMAPDAPRTGREHDVFHVATAYLQAASVNGADCDVMMEISSTSDKNAARVVRSVETPVDSEYCSARQNTQAQLKQHNFQLDSQHGGELPQALPAQILDLAFEDFEHNHGSAQGAMVGTASRNCYLTIIPHIIKLPSKEQEHNIRSCGRKAIRSVKPQVDLHRPAVHLPIYRARKSSFHKPRISPVRFCPLRRAFLCVIAF